jgi:arsenate reductase
MGATPRDILRVRGTPAEELGLTDPAVSDEAILDAMAAHPILVERPIVVSPKGTVLARPIEKVQALL